MPLWFRKDETITHPTSVQRLFQNNKPLPALPSILCLFLFKLVNKLKFSMNECNVMFLSYKKKMKDNPSLTSDI